MVRSGKEPATPQTANAGSRAAAAKRKATAMSPEERAAKRLADQQRRRREAAAAAKVAAEEVAVVAAAEAEAAAQVAVVTAEAEAAAQPITAPYPSDFHGRQDRHAEAQAFAAALRQLYEATGLGKIEQCDFEDWLYRVDLPPDEESLCEWRESPSYERTMAARIAESCTCFLEPQRGLRCTCTYDGQTDPDRGAPEVPGLNCDHYDPRVLAPRPDDWQPSGGDFMPEGWDGAATGDFESELPPLQPQPPSPPPPPPPAAHHQPATSGAADTSDNDSDAYELDQERMLEEQGRISAIHGQPWHEVTSGTTEPMHWLDYIKRPFEWLASSLRHVQSERPLSPAPELSQFETEDDFLRERSRWFREHGDGSELPDATRREQNTVFQRLKDRLFGLRRARANPSGTPRAMRAMREGPNV